MVCRSMASLGRQSDKRAAIEAAVLEATEALLAEGATFAELNIERIATRAGISRTAFYFYFRDKRELLVRLTGEVNAELMAAADTWWSGEADMRTALQQVADIYTAHGRLLRAVVEVATYDEEVATYWRALVGRFVDATRERIEADQAEGRALPGPAHATAFALVWMAERSFYEHRVQGEPVDGAELVDALTAIFERTVYGTS
jgi:TetR/AcrR family transcriptional regulator, ethionamide resistance regulator